MGARRQAAQADAAAAPAAGRMNHKRAAVLGRVLDKKQETSRGDAQQRDTVNKTILDTVYIDQVLIKTVP